MKTGVIGYPLSHTLSPLIHNEWFQRYAIDGQYSAVPIPPARLASGIAALVEQNYAGFNVTIPHKQAVMAMCDTLDPVAQAVGAVNTVVIESGKLSGRNTDAYGFTANIEAAAPDFDWTAGPALVIGAGGAARAIMQALKDKGVPEIRMTNRTLSKAEALAEQYGAQTVPWEAMMKKAADHLHDLNLLVNTSALGMAGQPPLTLDLSGLSPSALVNDIVYAPLWTDLLRMARMRGNRTVTGIGMLLHQAAPAFCAWTGRMPDIDAALTDKVLDRVL